MGLPHFSCQCHPQHVSVEPCAVFAKDDQEAREVKGSVSANKSDAPITLVTLDTHGLTKVLVEPGPTVANVRLEHFGDEPKAPKPKAGSPDAKFNGTPIQRRIVMRLSLFILHRAVSFLRLLCCLIRVKAYLSYCQAFCCLL